MRGEVNPEHWAAFESASFRMLSDGHSEAATRILLDLERFRRAFTELAPGIDASFPVPTQLVAFRDAASYAPFKSERDTAETKILGQFLGHRDGNYITLDADPRWSGSLGVIIHEYVHHVINQNLPRVPRWLNEGLAEYYSTFGVEGRYAVIGRPVERHLRWWRLNSEASISAVLSEAAGASIHSQGDAGRFYAVSWALAHYLLSQPQGPDLLASYLEAVATGAEATDALLLALGVSVGGLEAELRGYIAAESMPATALALDDLGEIEIVETEASPADTLAVLAELAARIGNPRHAEELLYLALDYEPENADVLASLASLREDQGRFEEAGVLYADALARGPALARSYLRCGRYLLGAIERTRPLSAESAENLARRAKALFLVAAELDPLFAEAQVALAYVHLFDGLDAGDGLVFSERARELLPTRPDVVHSLIRLHLKLGAIDRADELVEGPLGVLADSDFQAKVRDEVRRADLLLAARAALSEGRWEDGIELFDRAIAHTESDEVRLQMEEQLDRLSERADLERRGGGSR